MAAVDYQRHRAALRVLLDCAAEPTETGPAPGYEGPALWFGPMPGQVNANADASALCEPGGAPESSVVAFAAEVAAAQAPRMVTICLEATGQRARHFALTGLPQDGGVLVLARETTKETDHIRALKASREMFRDIALSAGGLAFETDEKGLFRWVGPGRPLGFAPETMIGHPAKDFLLPQSPDAFDPFAARESVDDAPVWTQSLDLGPRALRMSVRPVFDNAGAWRGVRGHAHDETADIRHARRDRFVQSAIEAIRNAQTPALMAQALAAAAEETCQVSAAWIFGVAPCPDCVSSTSAVPCDLVRAIAGRAIAEGAQFPALFSAGEWTGLSIALRAQSQTQGALLVALPAANGEVTRDVQEVLRLIVPMASAAMAQVRLMAMANTHAARDALTGALSPTGWRDALAERLAANPNGAIFAIECDRFKAFGDGLGRAASEELLVEIAAQLNALRGPNGLCARLDEACFSVWYEGDTNGISETIAGAFRAASRRMSLALAAAPVIGLAQGETGDTADTLTDKALRALAAAKRTGRGRGAPPPCSKN
jgi:GGDEF domain-containing protein